MMVVMWKASSHIHTQWMNEANENVINESLLKGSLNRIIMNEIGVFWGRHS